MANVEHNFLNDERFFIKDGKVFSSDIMMNNDDTLAFLSEEIPQKLEKLLKEIPMYKDCVLKDVIPVIYECGNEVEYGTRLSYSFTYEALIASNILPAFDDCFPYFKEFLQTFKRLDMIVSMQNLVTKEYIESQIDDDVIDDAILIDF
ncbi:hypothetical protein [Rummeliibacillus pycnus]|uniref:hypothetical protein n=1 Tax=Rummeliibacillus pycnus TaxID=101070 RepID=UPI000C9A8BEE|nr:hypothetical protein [Rummeliibacillus pycnus]